MFDRDGSGRITSQEFAAENGLCDTIVAQLNPHFNEEDAPGSSTSYSSEVKDSGSYPSQGFSGNAYQHQQSQLPPPYSNYPANQPRSHQSTSGNDYQHEESPLPPPYTHYRANRRRSHQSTAPQQPLSYEPYLSHLELKCGNCQNTVIVKPLQGVLCTCSIHLHNYSTLCNTLSLILFDISV